MCLLCAVRPARERPTRTARSAARPTGLEPRTCMSTARELIGKIGSLLGNVAAPRGHARVDDAEYLWEPRWTDVLVGTPPADGTRTHRMGIPRRWNSAVDNNRMADRHVAGPPSPCVPTTLRRRARGQGQQRLGTGTVTRRGRGGGAGGRSLERGYKAVSGTEGRRGKTGSTGSPSPTGRRGAYAEGPVSHNGDAK